jgi:hypothetical protein
MYEDHQSRISCTNHSVGISLHLAIISPAERSFKEAAKYTLVQIKR